jgi:hypothetical protein
MGGEMNNILIILLVFGFSGCASVRAIDANYQQLVDVSDGVGEQEAKIIAQKEIISTYEQRAYRVTSPDIKTTQEALKYPDFWFVIFGHNWFSPMSTDALAKTYTELKETLYVVVIDKKTGSIKFSGEWFPKRNATFDWVFSPDAYRARDGLQLPPYTNGHKVGQWQGN